MLSTRGPPQTETRTQTESKGIKNIYYFMQVETIFFYTGVEILTSDKIDFKMKVIKGENGGHYIMIKWSIQQEDITLLNIYIPR